MMTDEATLNLAREDFAAQEGRREAFFQRLQFLLTASTLLIAANISLMTEAPRGWRWWLLATPSVVVWALLFWLFRLTWAMYHGHDYFEPKSVRAYVEWRNARSKELQSIGYPDAEEISAGEAQRFLMEDYAEAADHNRRINMEVQAINGSSTANRSAADLGASLPSGSFCERSDHRSLNNMAHDTSSKPPTTPTPRKPPPPSTIPRPTIDVVNRGLGSKKK